MALAVPLSRQQVEAANELYGRMDDWRRADSALARLRDRCPTFGPEDTLLKVVAVNSLYGTNVLATQRVARHVESLMTSLGSAVRAGPELVEQIATDQTEERIIRRYSFASKFAHFFIDSERFPIYDSYADGMLKYHLGSEYRRDPGKPYVAHFRNVEKLAASVEPRENLSRLDRYLWLAGQYRKWREDEGAVINSEARRVFVSGSTEVDGLLPRRP